jgi:hypothetical protein
LRGIATKRLFIDRRDGRDDSWHIGLLDSVCAGATNPARPRLPRGALIARVLAQLMWNMARSVPGWNRRSV